MNSSLCNGFKLTMQFEEFARSSKYNKCRECIVRFVSLFNHILLYIAISYVPSTKHWPGHFACEKMDNTPCLRWDSPREVPVPLCLAFAFHNFFGGKQKKHQHWSKPRVEGKISKGSVQLLGCRLKIASGHRKLNWQRWLSACKVVDWWRPLLLPPEVFLLSKPA